MSVTQPVQRRPSQATALGGLQARVAALERDKQRVREWALVRGAISGGGPTQTYIDLVDFTAYPDNDSTDLFGLHLGTAGLSATHGVAITDSGVYHGQWVFNFSAATNGDTLVGNYAGELGVTSGWVSGNSQAAHDRLIYQAGSVYRLCFSLLIFVDGPIWTGIPAVFPLIHFPSAEVAGGSGTFDVDVAILLERLTRGYTTNLGPGDVP